MSSRLSKYTTLIILITFCNTAILAQETEDVLQLNPTNKATLFGIGASNMYDTYLSPIKYKGISLQLFHEQMKRTSWFGGKFTRQFSVGIEYSTGENMAKNAREYFFMADINWGGHYDLYKTDKFRFSAGALWNISAGVLYNERNSNNPASARLRTNINLSAIAFYKWKIATFRWQMDSPVIGLLFSPNFGQSYYEISLGNTVGTANFASLHNQRALRNYITVDFPVNKFIIRVGYLGEFYQTKVNHLQTHHYTNSFVIGLVSESINLNKKKIKNPNVSVISSYYFND